MDDTNTLGEIRYNIIGRRGFISEEADQILSDIERVLAAQNCRVEQPQQDSLPPAYHIDRQARTAYTRKQNLSRYSLCELHDSSFVIRTTQKNTCIGCVHIKSYAHLNDD